jgi:hypothetical protein
LTFGHQTDAYGEKMALQAKFRVQVRQKCARKSDAGYLPGRPLGGGDRPRLAANGHEGDAGETSASPQGDWHQLLLAEGNAAVLVGRSRW